MGTCVRRQGLAVLRGSAPATTAPPSPQEGRPTRTPRRRTVHRLIQVTSSFWRAQCRLSILLILRGFSSDENLLFPGIREQIVHRLFALGRAGSCQPIFDLEARHAVKLADVVCHADGIDGARMRRDQQVMSTDRNTLLLEDATNCRVVTVGSCLKRQDR